MPWSVCAGKGMGHDKSGQADVSKCAYCAIVQLIESISSSLRLAASIFDVCRAIEWCCIRPAVGGDTDLGGRRKQ